MKRKNQNRFSFNIYERRGILLLCFLFIVTSCIYFLLPQIIPKKKKYSFPAIKPFNFDPNKISESDLSKMKLAPYIVKTISKYRNKGGVFKKKEDLKKIYGITDSIYTIIEPYIQIQEQTVYQPRETLSTISFIELNSATAEDLESNEASVKELGSHPLIEFKWAKVIVNFRKQHGNYSDINELSKIKIIKEADLEKIKPYLGI